jgi:serine/threonine protein kinase
MSSMTGILAPGDVVAERYRIDRFVGRGGMGVVWAATDLRKQHSVALKMLRRHAGGRTDLKLRLLREARAAMAVEHPNVVRVHEVFETADDETPVVVMDLLEGETLGAKLAREEKLGVEETAIILNSVVSAVCAAHDRGIVHRDLKPDNIFLARTASGVDVKVLDFGVAKLTDTDEDPGASVSLTHTGALVGTPCYMAPEQCCGEKDVDGRADVWSLGVILYECLAGGRPIEGDNVGQVVKSFMSQGITPLRRVAPDLPSEITRLVERMLVREREHRLGDLREAARVLAAHAAGAERAEFRATQRRDPGSRAPARGPLFLLALLSVGSLEYSIVRSHPGQLVPAFVESASKAAPLAEASHPTAKLTAPTEAKRSDVAEQKLPPSASPALPPLPAPTHARLSHRRASVDADRTRKHPDVAPHEEPVTKASTETVEVRHDAAPEPAPAATVLGGLAAKPPF